MNKQANIAAPLASPSPANTGQVIDKPATQPRKGNGKGNGATEMGVSGMSLAAAENVAQGGKPATKANLFAIAGATVSEKTARKLTVMQESRQKLAQAADLYAEGDGKAIEAAEVADSAALLLYQAHAEGLADKSEVSAILGDVFGFKPKADGKPGKTPNGQGEAIRKRVVRLATAADWVANGTSDRFFDGLPKDEIETIVAATEAGNMSIWTAYERFAEVKRENAIRTNAAFDPKRVAAFVESLSEEGAAAIIAANPALVTAYAALIDVLNAIGEEGAKLATAEVKAVVNG
jgi:hypothetical protein